MRKTSASRYLKRLHGAASPNEKPSTPLSDKAKAFVLEPGARIDASVFSELVREGYIEPTGRKWLWTVKAKALQSRNKP